MDHHSIGERKTVLRAQPHAGFALLAGMTVGPYCVVEPLGRGGMGEVYLVDHEHLHTRHALKIIRQDWAGVCGFVDRFFHEARLMARLRHPRIVHCLESGMDRGMPWLAMDYIEGPRGQPMDLQTLFDERRDKSRLFDEDEAVAVGLQICEALAYAHTYRDSEVSAGIVHRDLKPSNILLGKDTRLYVTDFGLARLIGPEFERSVIRQSMAAQSSLGAADTLPAVTEKTTDRVGTFDYMSPEQREGKEADARSDVYALGAILYELLTGRKVAGVPNRLSKARPGLSPVWDGIVYERCLAADPGERFHSAAELKDAILRATATERVVTAQQPAPKVSGKDAWTNWAISTTATWRAAALSSVQIARSRLPAVPKWSLAVSLVLIAVLGSTSLSYRACQSHEPPPDHAKQDTQLDVLRHTESEGLSSEAEAAAARAAEQRLEADIARIEREDALKETQRRTVADRQFRAQQEEQKCAHASLSGEALLERLRKEATTGDAVAAKALKDECERGLKELAALNASLLTPASASKLAQLQAAIAQWQDAIRSGRTETEKAPRVVQEHMLGRPGSVMRDWMSYTTGMRFIWIPALEICVGEYEVTNAEYHMKDREHDTETRFTTPNWGELPVVNVDFDDAKKFAEWMTKRDQEQRVVLILPKDRRYRLPSEQEWQAFAQCGDGREYPWGKAMPPIYGNYADATAKKLFSHLTTIRDYDDGFAGACPVKRSGRNTWDLYGVGGNVWEMTASDSSGQSFGALRGGSWYNGTPESLRCTYRNISDRLNRDMNDGFRLVLSR